MESIITDGIIEHCTSDRFLLTRTKFIHHRSEVIGSLVISDSFTKSNELQVERLFFSDDLTISNFIVDGLTKNVVNSGGSAKIVGNVDEHVFHN